MKTRLGFISNSSSASFIVFKQGLSESILNKVRNPMPFAEKLSKEGYDLVADDNWNITEDLYYIKGSTIIDNYPMDEYLTAIGLEKNKNFIYERD
jgi:hypothetical protein